ncbi:MAG: SDR family oxidoreductase [bacterium]|jgi:decaprenylphospho-beta-D-erythro-pentofuranosid-2-ulose 2-reductase
MAGILILGAKSDIAKAIAVEYAKAGYDLYLAARNHELIAPVASDIQIRYNVKAQTLEFDALDYENHQAFYEQLNPRPIGVFCVFGYLGDQEKAKTDFSEAKKIIDINYTGCVSILNVVANDLEQRREGFIVGVSSVAGDRGRQSNYYYGSAKAGFSAYLSGLRNRLFHAQVQVLTVKPGFVRTQMTAGMKLPALLTASPEAVAHDVFKAQQKTKDILYTRWYWRIILGIFKILPERVFKRLKT